MAGLGLDGLDGLDGEHVGAVGTAAYPAETTPSGVCHGGPHHDCASFDVGIDEDEVLAVIIESILILFLKDLDGKFCFFALLAIRFIFSMMNLNFIFRFNWYRSIFIILFSCCDWT